MVELDKEKTQLQEGIIDLKDLIHYLFTKWITILIGSALIGFLSILYSFLLTNEYTAVIYLTEVKKDEETFLSNTSAERSFGISLPGGLGVGNGLSSEMNTVIIMMKSWDFIDEFIRVNNLEAPILAGNDWDPITKRLLYDKNKYDELNAKWEDKNFNDEDPSVRWELYKKFIDNMRIIGDKNTGVHILSISYYDPERALDWANKFYKLANAKLREKKLININNNIINLEKQISENTNSILKEKLYDILSKQINSKAVIGATPNYVLEPLGRSLIPFERSFPQRSLIVLGLTLVGTLILILGLMNYRFISVQRNGSEN